MGEETENTWRPIVAALANDLARTVYAEIVISGESGTLERLSPSRRRHVLDALTASGLIQANGAVLRPDPTVFSRALNAASAEPRPTGLTRFLDPEGRIRVYPADASTRAELLAAIAEWVLPSDEVLTERELNERLRRFTDDVAVLRRYLVDHGELVRTRSGSEYARS